MNLDTPHKKNVLHTWESYLCELLDIPKENLELLKPLLADREKKGQRNWPKYYSNQIGDR